MKRVLLAQLLFFLMACSGSGQFIDTVWAYVPAPGQFINTPTGGFPRSALSLSGGVSGMLSLGAFGGFMVFSFEEPVQNHPDHPYGVDFTIFGNPLPDWAEPGVVRVMRDENENGLPDDQWHVLAGSDYFFSTSRSDTIRYRNPGGTAALDVPWESVSGDSGVVLANGAHLQNYYPLQDSFPLVPAESCAYGGLRIEGMVDDSYAARVLSLHRAFGYADNHLRGTAPWDLPDNPYTREKEHAGGDAFDISWAVDSSGAYVDLPEIHFVMVQTAMQADGGWLGELSTEIAGAVAVSPLPGWEGCMDMLVIRDLPLEMDTGRHRLELFHFSHGRVQPDADVEWILEGPGAEVDTAHVLSVKEEGVLTLTARLRDQPEISASQQTTVRAGARSTSVETRQETGPVLYPNPCADRFYVRDACGATLYLCSLSGQCIRQERLHSSPAEVRVGDLQPGIYLAGIGGPEGITWKKIVRH